MYLFLAWTPVESEVGDLCRCSWTARDNGKTPAVLEHVDIFIFVTNCHLHAMLGANQLASGARIEIASCRFVRGRDVAWRRLAKSRLPASSHPPRTPSSRSRPVKQLLLQHAPTHPHSLFLSLFLFPFSSFFFFSSSSSSSRYLFCCCCCAT